MSIAEKLQTIAENEQKVYDKGYSEGYAYGDSTGYNSGYDMGYAEGQRSEYDTFWDTFQQNGNRVYYTFAFGNGWTGEMFRPKYSMRPINARYLFYKSPGEKVNIPDFVERCNELGIVIDFSNCTDAEYAFYTLDTKHLGSLNFSKCTKLGYLFGTPDATSVLETIDEFVSSETTQYMATTFQGANALKNITFRGVIASNNVQFHKCPLSHDSIMNIINVLKDYSGTTTKRTLTLGSSNLAKLTDAEKAIATQKGWTLA